jgi:hypothetical protein
MKRSNRSDTGSKNERESILEELRQELLDIRSGKSQVEPYTGREGKSSAGKVNVAVSRSTYVRLSNIADEKNLDLAGLLDALARKVDRHTKH